MGKKKNLKNFERAIFSNGNNEASSDIVLSKQKMRMQGISKKGKRMLKRKLLLQNLIRKSSKLKKKEKENAIYKAQEGTHTSKESSLYFMNDMLGPLLDSAFSPSPLSNSARLSSKSRSTEVQQFKNVLAHPAFDSDPLKAITEHITNSVQLLKKQVNEKQQFEDKHLSLRRKMKIQINKGKTQSPLVIRQSSKKLHQHHHPKK